MDVDMEMELEAQEGIVNAETQNQDLMQFYSEPLQNAPENQQYENVVDHRNQQMLAVIESVGSQPS